MASIRIILMESYEEIFIKEIQPTTGKIAISGTVLTRDEKHLVVDDGTGSIGVILTDHPAPLGEYLRVFGTVIPDDAGYQLQADLVQDLSNIDKIAHKNVKEKLRKI